LLIAGGFEVNRFGSGEFDEFGADEFGACTCGLVLVGGKEYHMRLVVYSNL
jgi:hypothetical protein